MIFDRSLFWSMGLTALISLVLIFLGSPLFQTLGLEYSTLSALALSLIVGVRASRGASRGVGALLTDALIVTSVPLLISIFSLPIISNCAFGDGLLLYIEIAVPSALLGAGFGFAFSLLIPQRKLRVRREEEAAIPMLSDLPVRPRTERRWTFSLVGPVALFVGFWTASLLLSLLPGYFTPQIFTYGWQYGYFPGFIWDEALGLGSAYLWLRIENVLLVGILLSLALVIKQRANSEEQQWMNRLLLYSLALTFGVLTLFNNELGLTRSHEYVERQLSASFESSSTVVHYVPGTLTDDERQRLSDDLWWFRASIIKTLGATEVPRRIDLYLYSSAEQMQNLVGTNSASIAKPWLGELHMAKANIESLKHELAHVLLRAYGKWPFDVSWATGLTEGAAMSVEPEYNGAETIDQLARAQLDLGYAKGVSGVMSFSGFAANASVKSYILAGSFSKFLLAHFGAERFLSVYSSMDFEQTYGASIQELEAEWKKQLPPSQPMKDVDSLRYRYFFERSSILFQPCLRRIGKLDKAADEAYADEHFETSDSLYDLSFRESGSVTALRGRLFSLIRSGSYGVARLFVDTARRIDRIKQLPGIIIVRGDVYALNHFMAKALTDYEMAQRLMLGEDYFLVAYTRRQLLLHTGPAWFQEYLSAVYSNADGSVKAALLENMLLAADEEGTDPRLEATSKYLLARELRSRGALKLSLRFYEKAASIMDQWVRSQPRLPMQDSTFLSYLQLESLRLGSQQIKNILVPESLRAALEPVLTEISKRREFLTASKRPLVHVGHPEAPIKRHRPVTAGLRLAW